ncbi:hypothetical protein OHS58_34060 [Amycolatopsis sp. NBC_00348]|uniref:hypothetical protein n=1 Tax=Amycolatopsis sp. NBC_00348 TaxID=2975956 RepID=UPI002E26E074
MTTQHAATRTRTEQATTWVVWHFAELLAVAAPLVLAWLVSGWLALLSLLAAAAWTVHEITDHRRTRAQLTGVTPRQITDTTSTTSTDASATAGRSDETREGAR